MRYVDGYVLRVPKKSLPASRRMARKAGEIWREHGALGYRECVGDDLDVKGLTPFLKDERLAGSMDPKSMPFDVKRMIYGGFKVLVDL
jgi:uncharacterized protein YbaA (DUF1428 family)